MSNTFLGMILLVQTDLGSDGPPCWTADYGNHTGRVRSDGLAASASASSLASETFHHTMLLEFADKRGRRRNVLETQSKLNVCCRQTLIGCAVGEQNRTISTIIWRF